LCTLGGTEQLSEGENRFPGNLQNAPKSAVEDAVALSPPSKVEENRKSETEPEGEDGRGGDKEEPGNVQVDLIADDEDEVLFLYEGNAEQAEKRTVEEEAVLLDVTREAAAAKESKEEEKLKEGGGIKRKRTAETDGQEGTNEDERLLVENEAMKEKREKGEPEVKVTFDTTAFEETPLTEGMKKIRDLQLELSALEKKEALIKMQKETVLQELRKEKKNALLLLQNSLEQE
jgi:hypothetical protein